MAVAPALAISAEPGSDTRVGSIAETAGSVFLYARPTGGVYTSATYAWSVVLGDGRVVGLGNNRALYAVPNVDQNTAIRVRVEGTFTDDDGSVTATATEDFTVTAVTTPPRVTIQTPAQTVNAGAVVQLRASASDPGGLVASQQWTATLVGQSLPQGAFNNANALNPRWTAPTPGVQTAYLLTCTVTDDDGLTASATVLITVRPPPELDEFGAEAGFSDIAQTFKYKRGELDDFGVEAGFAEPTPKAGLLGQLDDFGAIAGFTEAEALNVPPGEPFALSAFTRRLTSILLRWATPISGGPVDTYELEVRDGVWISTGSSAPEYLVSNLEPATTYRFRVRARNNGGVGPETPVLVVSTLSTLVPLVPRQQRAENTGGRSADLLWVAPVDEGGSAITHYEISVIDEDGQAGAFEPTDGPETRWRVRGLALWHEYGFRIRAVNANGPGPATQTFRHYVTPAVARTVPPGQRIPLLDTDRQSLVLRIANMDVLLRVWWQPSDGGWWASLEVPVNTPAISSRRLALNAGMLDGIRDILPGDIVLRELGDTGAEAARDAWARPTHALMWEPRT